MTLKEEAGIDNGWNSLMIHPCPYTILLSVKKFPFSICYSIQSHAITAVTPAKPLQSATVFKVLQPVGSCGLSYGHKVCEHPDPLRTFPSADTDRKDVHLWLCDANIIRQRGCESMAQLMSNTSAEKRRWVYPPHSTPWMLCLCVSMWALTLSCALSEGFLASLIDTYGEFRESSPSHSGAKKP